MSKKRILITEDDENLGQILSEYLEIKGFDCTLTRDGEQGLESFQNNDYDLCILDIMMPKKDGFSLAREIRNQSESMPIIFLTARSMKEDIIEGLKIGADDYLTKPFSMEELLLRIEAVLRRASSSTVQNLPKKVELGKFTFDYSQQILQNGESFTKLTSKESELLRMLVEHKNQTLDRSKALKKIWTNDTYFNARSMDVYITKIRKHLKDDPNLKIITVHGQGFRLVELSA